MEEVLLADEGVDVGNEEDGWKGDDSIVCPVVGVPWFAEPILAGAGHGADDPAVICADDDEVDQADECQPDP